MQQGAWKANMAAISQDICSVFWDQEIYYRAHRSPPPNACPEPDKMILSTPRSAKCSFLNQFCN
jgi:hypothetical protein